MVKKFIQLLRTYFITFRYIKKIEIKFFTILINIIIMLFIFFYTIII